LDFLLAEVWPERHRVDSGVPAPLASQPSAAPAITPVASFGNYAPVNSISTGGYGKYAPVFSPVLHINVPSALPARPSEHSKKHSPEKRDDIDPGIQSSVRAYFGALSGGKGAKEEKVQPVIDLNTLSDQEVLQHFKLPYLERQNQRSDFINASVAKAARLLNVHAVIGDAWTKKVVQTARDDFEDAKKRGELMMHGRGTKRDMEGDRGPSGSRGVGGEVITGVEPECSDVSGDDSILRKKATRSPLAVATATPVYSSPEHSEQESNDVKMADLNSEPSGTGHVGGETNLKKQKVVQQPDEEVGKWSKLELQNYLVENHCSKTGKKAELLGRVQRLLRIKEDRGAEKAEVLVFPEKDKQEAHEEPMRDAQTGELLPMVSSAAPAVVGKGVFVAGAVAASKLDKVVSPVAQKEVVVPAGGVAVTQDAFKESTVGLVQCRELLKKGEVVVAFHHNKITRMEVKEFHHEYDTSELVGCAWHEDTDGLTWIRRAYLICLPTPRQTHYDKGHYVFYFSDEKHPDYHLGQLTSSVQLTVSGSDVRVFKAQADGKTNFVFLEDVQTKKTGQYRPQNVIFDAILESDDVHQGEVDDEDFVFVTLPARVEDSSRKK
jgi:hypothetical protein